MEYFKTNWKDHIVDPITGEVIQQGTDIDAEHMNKIEDALEALGNENDSIKMKLIPLSIPAQSWSNKVYSYAVPDYNPDTMYCEPAFADYDSQTAWGKSAIFVSDDENESGTIVFTCNKDIPTVTLSLILKVGVLA